jgi:hypothetical protein
LLFFLTFSLIFARVMYTHAGLTRLPFFEVDTEPQRP